MPTKKTIVVPCMVKSRLKTCGETKVLLGTSELNAHQNGFESGDDEEDERVADVHQADLLMVDGSDPIVHVIEPASLMGRVDDDLGLRRHGSSLVSVKREEILRYGIEIVVVEMHCRH